MKERLYLDTRRSGYGPDQCGETMTVRALIELLDEYDENTEVYLRNDGGYTYGEITERSFELSFDEE